MSGVPEQIDNGVVRTAAEDLRKVTRRAHYIEVALVAAAAAAVMLMAITILAIGQTNKTGVDRIVSCTTPGEKCYEDQKAREDVLVADILAQLNEKHLVIECLLTRSAAPAPGQVQAGTSERQAIFPACVTEAQKATEEIRQEVARRAAEARRQAEQETNRE